MRLCVCVCVCVCMCLCVWKMDKPKHRQQIQRNKVEILFWIHRLRFGLSTFPFIFSHLAGFIKSTISPYIYICVCVCVCVCECVCVYVRRFHLISQKIFIHFFPLVRMMHLESVWKSKVHFAHVQKSKASSEFAVTRFLMAVSETLNQELQLKPDQSM